MLRLPIFGQLQIKHYKKTSLVFFGKIGRKVPQMALVQLDQVSSWTSCFGLGRFD